MGGLDTICVQATTPSKMLTLFTLPSHSQFSVTGIGTYDMFTTVNGQDIIRKVTE